MKSILGGFLAAAVIAVGAWIVLEGGVQRTADTAFTTTGARL